MGQELGNLPAEIMQLPVMMDDPLSQELAQPSGGCHWGKSNQTNWRVDSESRSPIILAMNMLNTPDVFFFAAKW